MSATTKLSDYFGANLAQLLAEKICAVQKDFDVHAFVKNVRKHCGDKTLTQRVELIADNLKIHLPENYPKAIRTLTAIMGPENERETGMFTNYYWLMPVGKFIEKFGIEHYDESIAAIRELTKRNTGEYAIRPFVREYPKETVQQMKTWAHSQNFHLRRLASEGLRPKLPWASKLDLFIEKPKPVFDVLEILKEEEVKFVKKSVANNVTDYIKVNPQAAKNLLTRWGKSKNPHTQWMVSYATRKVQRQ